MYRFKYKLSYNKKLQIDFQEAKDAVDITEDGEGRWFSFSLSAQSVVLLEKKTLPDHLTSLPSVDTPTSLSTLFRELEDAGEVTHQKFSEPLNSLALSIIQKLNET